MIETVNGIYGEWKQIFSLNQVKLGQMVRYGGCKVGYNGKIRIVGEYRGKKWIVDEQEDARTSFDPSFWGKIEAFFPVEVKKEKKKVLKVEFLPCMNCQFEIRGTINGVKFYNRYSSKSTAVRGAKRFCKSIGYEMQK